MTVRATNIPNDNDQFAALLLKNLASEVYNWNVIAGNEPSPYVEERQRQVYNQEKYLIEEIEELFDAASKNDVVEQIDALCDIMYVGVYLRILRGVPLFVENSDKDVETLFGESYSDSEIANRKLYTSATPKNACLRYPYIEQSALNLISTFGKKIAVSSVFEVVNSNKSKFIHDPDYTIDPTLLLESVVAKYTKEAKAAAVRVGDYIVIRADNGRGKILKPACYFAPNLTKILEDEAPHLLGVNPS